MAQTLLRCEVTPGCVGVVEDGYCTECGLAPRPDGAGSAAARSASVAAPGPVNGSGSASPASSTSASASVASSTSSVVVAGSARTGTGPVGSSRTAATATGSTRTGTGRSSTRRRIGAGLVSVPKVASRDPATAVLSNPTVPEDKRFCANCEAKVGRSRADRPGRPAGFCPSCGARYSFTPKLRKGDLVAGQYEVAGCLAHGGLGWIYLAVDVNVSRRWVVLKGLLDAGDPAAATAAVAEQRFLAEVQHPNIVKIINFVVHDGAQYIVMEYVDGASLKDRLKQRREEAGGKPDPLPLEQAIAYLVEVLPALGYLHEHQLLFCDFKPDNVIQTPDELKLIDLGAVVRIGADTSEVYGTVGFQAPEIADIGPSVESDLYTVARALAVLATDFRGYQSTYRHSLPARADVDVYLRFESLYRLLQRATATDPSVRFHSADEMAEQLLGVLREVLAANGDPHPTTSALFTGERPAALDAPDWHALPVLRVDPDDPAAAYLAAITVTDADRVLELLDAAPEQTPEIAWRAVRVRIDAAAADDRNFEPAQDRIDAATHAFGPDWRADWYGGVIHLAAGDPAAATASFDAVVSRLPGELAPKLALAVAAELADDDARAATYYDTVSATDPSYTTACAGLARCLAATGNREAAVSAFERVPGTSSAYGASRIGAVRTLIAPGCVLPQLARAATLLSELQLGVAEAADLRVGLLERALAAVQSGQELPPAVVDVVGLDPRAAEGRVRTELESAFRVLGRSAEGAAKIHFIDAANAVRPRTLR